MIAVKIGTTNWRSTSALAADEVEFTGTFVYEADKVTPAMVWDAGLNNIRAMTQADRDARESARLVASGAKAKSLLTANDEISIKDKAVLLTILDELNLHADKINAILTAIDTATGTNTTDLKARIAAIADYPARTVGQLRTAIQNKIDAGLANG